MEEKKTVYYRIKDTEIIGKSEDGRCSIWEDGRWVPDKNHIIMDHLMGYDPCEPDDSPYKMFNTSIMDEIEQITKEQAEEYTGYNNSQNGGGK